MNIRSFWKLSAGLLFAAAALWSAGAGQSNAEPPTPAGFEHVTNALCLRCHQQTLTIEDGQVVREVQSVNRRAVATSAHGKLACVKCHTDQSKIPHTINSALPGQTAALSCESCHADAAEGYREGPHGPVSQLGDDRAPACTSCHGEPHSIKPVEEWSESDRAAACAECHTGAGVGFLGASPGHRRPSAGFLSTPYFAGLFLMLLTAATLAFGIIHVELELLRWLSSRIARDHGPSRKGPGHGHAS